MNDLLRVLKNANLTPFLILLVLILPWFQTVSAWNYAGEKVDEAELVLFGVGMLGGDLNPAWDGYGHLGMYVLAAIYRIIGGYYVLTNEYSSLRDYAASNLFDGHFFVVARIALATIITAAIAIGALLLQRMGLAVWQCLLFVFAAAFSVTSVYYSNYVRCDVLVAFFTIWAVFLAIDIRDRTRCIWLSLVCAAAVASKISALSIFGFLFFILMFACAKKRISLSDSGLAILSFPIFILLFSPFMDYLGLIDLIVAVEYQGQAVSVYRQQYVDIGSRFFQLFALHEKAVGAGGLWLAALSIIGFWSKAKSIIAPLWLMLLLIVLPYMLGSTLRDYWFIPSYLIVAVLAAFTLGWIVESGIAFLSKKIYKRISIFLPIFAFILLSTKLAQGAISQYQHLSQHSGTNIENAKEWLIKNHAGKNTILIDRQFGWLYPKVYDPGHYYYSREMSALFDYERDKNTFLATIFEDNLLNKDYQSVYNSVEGRKKLAAFRIDFEGDVSDFTAPLICSWYSEECVVVALKRVNDISNVTETASYYAPTKTGNDPFVVFEVDKNIALDGSHYIKIETQARAWRLYVDYGQGFSENKASHRHNGSQKLTVSDSGLQRLASRFSVLQKFDPSIYSKGDILFVTSAWTSDRYRRMQENGDTPEKRTLGEVMHTGYRRLEKRGALKEFTEHGGAPISIYSIKDDDFYSPTSK